MEVLLSTAYWPNLHYLYYLLHSKRTVIEQHEHYGKQSFRNRCTILSANGPLNLSIPIKKPKKQDVIHQVEISTAENWRNNHWRALESAYKNSPYFDYFEQDLKPFYQNEFKHLLEYNLEQLHFILKVFRLSKTIELSQTYEKSPSQLIDLRDRIDPKISYQSDPAVAHLLTQPYYQTFGDKFNFIPNLSLLDLLFNKGLEGLAYLAYPNLPAQSR